ncbi:SMI1/KNR4 family protein [Cytobacillus sp. S13-E01]|uniref:SMI1/KNR4 family protein n=1 Tax=Cytobacillus sp. S13-E01 TaxID=3031326 RepID=UPI0023D86E41|nr:SMI1/KNR4 family protein [Cytobacillus sp. S13-E01]MDF0728884.1 SMI1/KNR4 family protein [Cytobacillus sp. S13-E01]
MSLKALFENKNFLSTGGVGIQKVEQAEIDLGFKIPSDYKELLLQYGALAVGTHEIAALGVEGYLNVIELTKQERALANNQLDNYIVIENLATEGLLIVLDEEGQVYEYQNKTLEKIYSDFKAYLKEEVL